MEIDIASSPVIGKIMRLSKETTVIVLDDDSHSYIACLPIGAIVRIKSMTCFHSALFVAAWSGTDFLIFDRDLSDAVVIEEHE
jgi:hypothetical protein